MLKIYYTHGVVANKKRKTLLHRVLEDKEAYATYLKNKEHKFVDLSQALAQNEGEVLTIDDSNYASYESALIANELGHKVTLFVNPYYIENNLPYYFSKLDYILDETKIPYFKFIEKKFFSYGYDSKKGVRKQLKEYIRDHFFEETTRNNFVEELAKILKVSDIKMPDYLRSMTLKELRFLQEKGVNIENHGWSHMDCRSLAPKQTATEINKGYNWLKENLYIDPKHYAVPFGQIIPNGTPNHFQMTYLANDDMPFGYINEGTFNRMILRF